MIIPGIIASSINLGGGYWVAYLADSQIASLQADVGYGIATDSNSNVYATGNFKNSSSGYDTFITKYNSSGAIQWQRSLADGNTAANQSGQGYGIATDSSSNVYATGYFTNTSGGSNVFITKYNSSGAIQWQRSLADSLAGSSQVDYGLSITADSTGNVYVSGRFANSAGNANAFITKYNSSGTIQWQRSLADGNTAANQATYGYSVATDPSGNICITGFFRNTSKRTNFYVAKIPNDGTKTGTWTIDSTHVLTYATGSLTDAAGSLTSATSSLTDAASSLTDAASSLTDAASTLTGAKVTL